MLAEGRVLYGLDDVCIVPAKKSQIRSRSECSPYHIGSTRFDSFKELPIFVAPMSCLTNTENIQKLAQPRLTEPGKLEKFAVINPILSRGSSFEDRIEHLRQGYWVAFGLSELPKVEDRFKEEVPRCLHICIDVANGHMQSVFDAAAQLKKTFADHVSIMVGNVANPETYREYIISGCVDYVRLGIGSGNVCTTSVQTGIHYPMASLISDCRKIADIFEGTSKVPAIVADGGFNRIDQCVKALALGADYIMLGRIIAQSDEACGKKYKKVYYEPGKSPSFISKENADTMEKNKILQDRQGITITYSLQEKQPALIEPEIYREYYGMSTKKAQREFNPDRPESELRHSEGLETFVPIKYSLTEWLQDFTHALKSSMSYTGHRYLETFIRFSECKPMSRTDFNAYMYKEV